MAFNCAFVHVTANVSMSTSGLLVRVRWSSSRTGSIAIGGEDFVVSFSSINGI